MEALKKRPSPSINDLKQFLGQLLRIYQNISLGKIFHKYQKTVLAVNLAGFSLGLWYYGPQLSNFSLFYLPLIIDSPLSTFFAAVYIVTSSRLIKVFASAFNTKYGIWTVCVLLAFHGSFLDSMSVGMFLFLLISHLGMVLQGIALLPEKQARLELLILFPLILLNDVSDYTYALGDPTHPLLPFQKLIEGNYTHPAQHAVSAKIAVFTSFTSIFMCLKDFEKITALFSDIKG